MKSIFSFVLLFAFVLSQVNALSSTNNPQLEAAYFLTDKGIIVDHKNNTHLYELEKEIQRQAVIKIVMKLSEKDIPDECRWDFSDVDTTTWPCKYIESALDEWYIAQNDFFRPFDYITLTEAMKLVLKAKGIQKIQETDNWQEDYMLTAYKYGIIEEKYYNYNDNATRGWIFEIATATIEKEDEIFEAGGIISDEAL